MNAFVVPALRKIREEWGTHGVIGTSEIRGWATRLAEVTSKTKYGWQQRKAAGIQRPFLIPALVPVTY